jgi:hypothetical protein
LATFIVKLPLCLIGMDCAHASKGLTTRNPIATKGAVSRVGTAKLCAWAMAPIIFRRRRQWTTGSSHGESALPTH